MRDAQCDAVNSKWFILVEKLSLPQPRIEKLQLTISGGKKCKQL